MNVLFIVVAYNIQTFFKAFNIEKKQLKFALGTLTLKHVCIIVAEKPIKRK